MAIAPKEPSAAPSAMSSSQLDTSVKPRSSIRQTWKGRENSNITTERNSFNPKNLLKTSSQAERPSTNVKVHQKKHQFVASSNN